MVTSVEHRWPLLLLLLLLTIGGLLLWGRSTLVRWADPHAVAGHYVDSPSEDQPPTEVPWYAMEISVASTMTVREGETLVDARLENVEENHVDQRVRMYETDDPTDLLYESGAIAPGEVIDQISLNHPLTVGAHHVTVEFQGYERQPSLISDEGVVLGHDTFGASCAAEVVIECVTAAGGEA